MRAGTTESYQILYKSFEIAFLSWDVAFSRFFRLPWQEFRAFELLRSGLDRSKYLLVKEAKIIAMTCTHAALKRHDLVELGFKVAYYSLLTHWLSVCCCLSAVVLSFSVKLLLPFISMTTS